MSLSIVLEPSYLPAKKPSASLLLLPPVTPFVRQTGKTDKLATLL
jgi:hypothetical protein